MKSMIWGIIIIVIGVSVLLGAVFGINIPIIKVLFGLFLLYLGIKVLMGAFSFQFTAEKRSSDFEAIFSSSQFQYPNSKDSKEYVTVFGQSTLDLVSTSLEELNAQAMKSVTVFGESVIYVKKGQPLRVTSNTVFGKSELPGKNISAFGKFEYQTPGLSAADPALQLDVTSIFGNTRILEKE